MKAIWNETVLAESNAGIVVEGNYYFPPDAVRRKFLTESVRHTVCSWKGTASYYDLVMGDKRSANAAWYYPQPKDAAVQITDYVAFYRDRVEVIEG